MKKTSGRHTMNLSLNYEHRINGNETFIDGWIQSHVPNIRFYLNVAKESKIESSPKMFNLCPTWKKFKEGWNVLLCSHKIDNNYELYL